MKYQPFRRCWSTSWTLRHEEVVVQSLEAIVLWSRRSFGSLCRRRSRCGTWKPSLSTKRGLVNIKALARLVVDVETEKLLSNTKQGWLYHTSKLIWYQGVKFATAHHKSRVQYAEAPVETIHRRLEAEEQIDTVGRTRAHGGTYEKTYNTPYVVQNRQRVTDWSTQIFLKHRFELPNTPLSPPKAFPFRARSWGGFVFFWLAFHIILWYKSYREKHVSCELSRSVDTQQLCKLSGTSVARLL